MPVRAAIHRKLLQPFIELLKQGVTPEKIALTVALGISLGVIPVIARRRCCVRLRPSLCD
jgi:hypothetical protein